MPQMQPRVSKRGRQLQLTYEFPSRIFIAKTYPAKSPNGSTIIIYGYEGGVGVLWRGGRPLKQAGPGRNKKPLVNGVKDDTAVIIDVGDEAQGLDEAGFDSEEEDPSATCPHIMQHIEIPLDSAALHLAVPNIASPSASRQPDVTPILSKKIVVAASCADGNTRVISIPLLPPSHARKDARREVNGPRWGEQIVAIASPRRPNSLNTVALTWTTRQTLTDDESRTGRPDTPREQTRSSRSRSRNRGRLLTLVAANRSQNHHWEFLVASHSADATGVLSLIRIPVFTDRENNHFLATGPEITAQTQYLPSPASRLAFNPASHPSKSHCNLLVVDPKGAVKVFDPRAPSRSNLRQSRRNGSDQGSWIASFQTPFSSPKGDSFSPNLVGRKRVLDAQWSSHGTCITVVLEDGEWGVWDFAGHRTEGGGRPPSSFIHKGTIGLGDASTTASTKMGDSRLHGSRSVLAPMTPNTRRAKGEKLFSAPTAASGTGPANGGISVLGAKSLSASTDESLVLWYGYELYKQRMGFMRIDGLDLGGELLQHVDQLLMSSASDDRMELLAVAEHRIIILSTPQIREFASALQPEPIAEAPANVQSLLDRGELDLGGLDSVLENMGRRFGNLDVY